MAKIRENPIKMDDLGVPLLLETPIFNQIKLLLIMLKMFDLDTFYGNLFEICHDYIAKNNLLRVLCFDKYTYT